MIYTGPLGAKIPDSKPYADKYKLSASTIDSFKPVVIGVNWYTNFDAPIKDSNGRYWVGRTHLGSIRGGHAVCLKSAHKDFEEWHLFYNQGREGACVGFAVCRGQSLYNQTRYDGFWHYRTAQDNDEWAGNQYEGTSVNAGFKVARDIGMVRVPVGVPLGSEEIIVRPGAGISAYRWTNDVNEIINTLGLPVARSLGAVPFLNSWGAYYPRITWMPAEVLQRLLNEGGDAGVPTDR